VSNSILTSTKKILGLDAAYTAFDEDILMHINSALSTLNQLGIGPDRGLTVPDATTTWDALIGTDARLNSVKTYVYMKVRLIFDPPTTSYMIEAMNKQVSELEWRLNTYREATAWSDPTVVPVLEPNTVLDGGTP